MAKFKFKGAEYQLVEVDDLTFQEVSDMEEFTSFDMIKGKVSIVGLTWISIRRKFPQTTFADVAQERLLKIEWMEDEDAESLPPTLNGAADTGTVDAPTELLARTASGNPG